MTGIIQGLLASIGSAVASAASDAYFNLVTLLLNTSSTNGAQNNTFLDSSTNNFTVTRNGNTSQGTFTPFSQTGWSNYFNGTGSGPYLRFGSSSALTFGTGDFTIEFWVNFLSINDGTVNYIYDMRDGGSGSFLVGEPSNTWTYINGAGNSVTTGMTSSTFSANQWYHVAICRASGVINFYVNGTKVSSNPADTSNYATSYISIMSRSVSDGANNNTNAYTSNFRIVKGTAVYTSNFTPSTTPLTAISGTSLLTCQANRFVDNSGNALTVAVDSSLSPSVQAFSPFAPTAAYDTAVVGGSGYFVNGTDYLTLPTGSVNVGSSDFTIAAWIYPLDRSNGYYVFGGQSDRATQSGSSYNWSLSASTGIMNAELYVGGGNYNFSASSAPPLNAWSYVVLARTGGTASLYINGVRVGTNATLGTAAVNTGSTTYAPAIGANGAGSSSTFSGYISNLRFIIGSGGVDATQSTITIPTALQTNVTNTKLLSDFTNAGIYDSASKNVLETVGNAQVSTTQAKWGTTSMYFDGTGDSLILPNSPIYDFGTGNFTIEGWVYIVALSGSAQGTFIGRGINSGASFHIAVSTGGTWLYYLSSNNSSWNIASAVSMGSATVGSWQHVALVRNGTTFTPYLNGVAGTTTTNSSAIYWNSGSSSVNQITIGGSEASTPLQVLNGYIDDLRISKYARYTSNFTPATAAFPVQ